VVSIDLGNPNREYGVVQRLEESPGGWSTVATLGGETGRAILFQNPAGRPSDGIYLDVLPPFDEAAHGKTLWVLVEIFSENPEKVELYFQELGKDSEAPRACAMDSHTTLPATVRANGSDRWGYLLFRCENVSLDNPLRGTADLLLSLPDERAVVNRVLVTRTGPELSLPDTGGLSMSFFPQNSGRIQGPSLSPLESPKPLGAATGKVVDPKSVGPVGGVQVEILDAVSKSLAYRAYTDSLGEYKFPIVEAGNYRLKVSFAGKDPGSVSGPYRVKEGLAENDLGTAQVSVYGHLFTSRFRSELDDTEQTYALYLPANYATSTNAKYPLVVALHDSGEGPAQCLTYMVEANRKSVADACILLGPGARGDSNYEGIGEADLLEAIRYVGEKYRIDPDRVHLTGYGMGGAGALKLAARRPDEFASVSALAAFTDLVALAGSNELVSFEKKMLEASSPRYFQANLRDLPVRLYQPKDVPLLVEQGRRFRDEMTRYSQPFLYREIPGQGEEIMKLVYGVPEFFSTVARDRRHQHPSSLSYESATLTPGGAYWIAMTSRERVDRPCRVDARLVDRHTVWVESANVTSLEVDLNQPSLDPYGEAKVWWNGNLAWTGIPRDKPLAQILGNLPSGRWYKTPGTTGPASAVFLEPYLYVIGDSIRWTRKEEAYRNWTQSQEWAGHDVPFRSAQEIRSEDLKTKNLILFGLPSENSLVQTLKDDLPIEVKGTAVSMMGNRYEGNDVGFATVFPNPLSEDRLILWVAGFTERGIENLSRTGFRWPDYLIVDEALGRTGQAADVLCAGFYDRAWRYSDADAYKRTSTEVSEANAKAAPVR
jgi:pimeloyl-ACP methyl ester carboxylesterase